MDYIDYIEGQTEENFWFKGKKRLINILLSKINLKNLKILNIGAGTGADLDILNRYGDIFISDINKKALDLIPEDFYKEKKVCSATNLQYPDEKFDVVCSFDVFEHIEDDKKVVTEVYRVLKKGGFLFFTVPAFNFLYSAHDRALKHIRRYNKKTMIQLLKKFRYIEISFWNSFLFIPFAILRYLKKKSKPKTDYFNLPSLIEKVFYKILTIENRLIKNGYKLPLGLSLIGYCKK